LKENEIKRTEKYKWAKGRNQTPLDDYRSGIGRKLGDTKFRSTGKK